VRPAKTNELAAPGAAVRWSGVFFGRDSLDERQPPSAAREVWLARKKKHAKGEAEEAMGGTLSADCRIRFRSC
jgi:hypothetical protein